MYELGATCVTDAVVEAVRDWMPDAEVCVEAGQAGARPYFFVEQMERHTTGQERRGRIKRFYYDYLMNVRYYGGAGELKEVELGLERALRELEMWGGLVETTNRKGRLAQGDGMVDFSFNVPVYEDAVPLATEKVERLDVKGVELGET